MTFTNFGGKQVLYNRIESCLQVQLAISRKELIENIQHKNLPYVDEDSWTTVEFVDTYYKCKIGPWFNQESECILFDSDGYFEVINASNETEIARKWLAMQPKVKKPEEVITDPVAP